MSVIAKTAGLKQPKRSGVRRSQSRIVICSRLLRRYAPRNDDFDTFKTASRDATSNGADKWSICLLLQINKDPPLIQNSD
ncbi:MAG: hypothetical protein LBC68_06270 [Prevotellaceae bacterium]|nr:hypothetical protein [Prevotellaceae bacterium]